MGKEKNNKHKEFWRDAPWFVSRLSRGHVPSVPSSVPSVPRTFCPLNVNFHINRPKRPRCPWDVPNLSPGRSRGIPTIKVLYVIFLYQFFVLHITGEINKEKPWRILWVPQLASWQRTPISPRRVTTRPLNPPPTREVPKQFQGRPQCQP